MRRDREKGEVEEQSHEQNPCIAQKTGGCMGRQSHLPEGATAAAALGLCANSQRFANGCQGEEMMMMMMMMMMTLTMLMIMIMMMMMYSCSSYERLTVAEYK